MSDTPEVSPFVEFKADFMKQAASIEKLLPPGVEVERFMRTALLAVQAKPDLLFADRKSLMLSCMAAAKDGLLPDGKEAALNVYNTKMKEWSEKQAREVEVWVPAVQYLPMVRGIIKVMYECGVRDINAAAVYRDDHFKFLRGDDNRIEHEPSEANDPGPIRAAYAIFKLANGETHREVMYARDIDKVRQCAKTQGVWTKWPDQMAIKSVIKRAAKHLPWSPDAMERIMRVIESDNAAMGYGDEDDDAPAQPAAAPAQPALTDERAAQAAQQVPTTRRGSRMANILRQHQQPPVADAPPPYDDIPWEDDPRG